MVAVTPVESICIEMQKPVLGESARGRNQERAVISLPVPLAC